MKLILGSHMSMALGFLSAVERTYEEYSANALQVFCKSPRGRFEKPLDLEEAAKVKKYVEEKNIYLFSHASYMLNFGKPLDEDLWPIQSLVSDLIKTQALGGRGVVLHVGKYLERDKAEAFEYMKINLNKVLEETSDLDIPILLETTAGQGTEIGYRFDELATVYDLLISKGRVKFCFDTAHVFAAGYDLRTKDKVKETFTEFDKYLGVDNLKLIHLNDSKKAFESRVDRHANFEADDAMIGKVGIKSVMEFAINKEIPMVIETPEKDGRNHLDDLEIIREWI